MKLSFHLRIICIFILLDYKKVRINGAFYSCKLSRLVLADSMYYLMVFVVWVLCVHVAFFFL